MAIIECPECKKEVSNKAKVCPNCGYPILDYVNEVKEQENVNLDKINCPFCGIETISADGYCDECGMQIDLTSIKKNIRIEDERSKDSIYDNTICCPKCFQKNIKIELFKVNKRKPYGLKTFFAALSMQSNGLFLLLILPVLGWIILFIIYKRGYKVTEETWMICQNCGFREEV
ncbi:MAG: Double zinc ribbon [Lachnospiraceae bacterium]|jgi:hypothetical protein|nr:Double zinc ribbon [Lachnospiraceae bacterium]